MTFEVYGLLELEPREELFVHILRIIPSAGVGPLEQPACLRYSTGHAILRAAMPPQIHPRQYR